MSAPRTAPPLDDRELRQPVASELLRRGLASRELLHRTERVRSTEGGLFTSRLVEAGVPPAPVLEALARAAGLPIAPAELLRRPEAPALAAVPASLCRAVAAVPFALRDGELWVAYANPAAIPHARAQGLGPHRAFVALEADVKGALAVQASPTELIDAAAVPPGTGPEAGAHSRGFGPPAASATQPAAPLQLGGYALESQLGAGGMATVYRARDPSGRAVALKVMLPHLSRERGFVQRFIEEARATVEMRHPNLVEVLSYGEDQGQYFIATELVEGGALEAFRSPGERLPSALVLEVAAQLLAGLGHAHGRGIVHRDLKPANLLLSASGELKVADFGIAKRLGNVGMTQTGMSVGTPAYMSPEQAAGKPVDARSDLFSCGVLLYELLSGSNPHEGPDVGTSIRRLLRPTPPLDEAAPSVPPLLSELTDHLLEREPSARPASVAEVLARLEPELGAVRDRHPALLAHFVRDPQGLCGRLWQEEAAGWRQKGEEAAAPGGAGPTQAALCFYRALLCWTEDAGARQALERLASAHRLSFGPSASPQARALEERLEAEPKDVKALQQLGRLYAAEGNVVRAVACYRRYLKLRPQDGYAAGLLTQLTGERVVPRPQRSSVAVPVPAAAPPAAAPPAAAPPAAAPPAAAPPAAAPGSTAELMAGIRTGGIRVLSAPGPLTQERPRSPPVAPMPPELGVPGALEDDSALAQLARAYRRPLLVGLLLVGLVGLGLFGVRRLVSHSTEETTRAADQLRRKMDREQALQGARQAEEQRLGRMQERAMKAREEADRRELQELERRYREEDAARGAGAPPAPVEDGPAPR